MDITTYEDLYNFLQSYPNDIQSWLNERWQGKDKQEALLRLFAGLGLINKLNSFQICKGNFNLKTIQRHNSIKDIFYTNTNIPTKLKDKGDASDLTGIHYANTQHILLTTSKNINKLNINKLDIEKIITNLQQYKGFTITLCIVIRNIDDFHKMMANIEETNQELKSFIDNNNPIIIDWNDLNEAFHHFQLIFGKTPINSILNSNKKPLTLKLHQQLSVIKTIQMKKEGKNQILWGHIQRSGKSYIIAGSIIEDNKANYLIITTAPNETIEQYLKVFDCFQLNEFNIIHLKNKDIPQLTNKNIIICSKQFLQTKTDKNAINWLKKIEFDIRFIDESHNGGSTELAQKILQEYSNKSFTIQITATYAKPINSYNIPQSDWILWDLEDIKLCKNGSFPKLIEKHGKEIDILINQYSLQNIINEYTKYPELWLLTDKLNEKILTEVINQTKDNKYGWSIEACFLLKQASHKNKVITIDEFQNETEALKVWYRIFGKKNQFGIPHPDYSDDIIFMKRIEKICKNPLINSRFIGEVIIAFLPQIDIDTLSKATIKLLTKYNVIPDYEIININSKTTTNPKQAIENARIKAKNSNKKGVLALSGKQCSLGVSIPQCDIVLLLNNNTSFDMIYQMMFRCMTEDEGKKCGFVIDLNIHRTQTTIIDYAMIVQPEKHLKQSIHYLLQERLITLNGDHWMPCFGSSGNQLSILSKDLYEKYISHTENALEHFLSRLRTKELTLTKEEQKVFSLLFIKNISIREKKEVIKKGIEETLTSTPTTKTMEKKTNYMDILKHLIPLICLLTIYDENMSFLDMFNSIENNKYIHNILINQIKTWWGNKVIDEDIFNQFITIYTKYIKDDKEINRIITTIKELFRKNINNSKQLSSLIDKYLIPQELEKKSNAEVSTPFNLRQEMLNVIPHTFWTNPNHTILEPCSGKGGFLLDIITRFMDGLKPHFPNEKERYKHIVENCLYWCDINPTNVFICKLLINPQNEYKLNYNEGDTLKLEGKHSFPTSFDAIIGNPPYSTDPSKHNSKPLYNLFIEKLINKCKYLLFVIPSRWFIGGKNLDKFRNMMMNRKDIKLIVHEDNAKKWFGNKVEIKGGTSYFFIDKSYNGKCSFNGIEYDLSQYDCIIKPKYHSIINKLNHRTLSEIYMGRYFNIETNDKRLKDKGKIKCYVSQLKSPDRCKFLDDYPFTKENTFWKVITTEACHKGYSGFGEVFIGAPNEVHTGSYISFKVNSEDEAKSLVSYLKTDMANKMLSSRKVSQHIHKDTCKWIPLPPLDRIWDNTQVNKYFNQERNLSEIYMGRYFNIETNDKRLKDKGKVKCYVSQLKSPDRCKFLDDYPFTKENTFWKVITSRASHKGYSGFGEVFIGAPNEVHTGSYISFKVNSEDEAKSLMSYLKTDFANHILSMRKPSQDIHKDTCKWIPLPPLDRIWDNTQVNKYFNTSQ